MKNLDWISDFLEDTDWLELLLREGTNDERDTAFREFYKKWRFTIRVMLESYAANCPLDEGVKT